MIIMLHQDFASLPSYELKNYSSFISNILDSHANRWHLFACGRNLGENILNILEGDRRRISVILSIIQRFGQTSALLAAAETILVFYDPKIMSKPVGKKFHAVDINFAQDLACLGPVKILVEDSRYDKFVIECILEALHRNQKLPSVPFKVYYKHCGGSGYTASIGDVVQDQSMFVCVIDSDKKSPYSSDGDTARLVRSYLSDNRVHDCIYHEVILTPSREIENFIPPLVYDHFWANSPERRSKLDRIKRIFTNWPQLSSKEKEFYKYFDFKKGIDFDKIWNTSCEADEIYKKWVIRLCNGRNINGLSDQIIQEILYIIEKSTENVRAKRDLSRMFSSSPLNEDIISFARAIYSVSIHNPQRIF